MKSRSVTTSRRIRTDGTKTNTEQPSPTNRAPWRREVEAQDVTHKLGQRIREHRVALGLSLNRASEATGLPEATLSRIENNKMAPTFSVLLKIMSGLKLSWQTLVARPDARSPDDDISIMTPDKWTTEKIAGYTYILPHSSSRLVHVVQPLIFDVDSRSLDEAGGLTGHQGIEFCYVISGTLKLHLADKPPQVLPTGGSALFDSTLPHAYVSKGRKPARVLNVVVQDPLLAHGEGKTPFGERIKKSPRQR